MKKIRLLTLIAVIALGSIAQSAFAQFEGVIKFDKVRRETTTKYAYYVSGSHIRVEDTGADGKVKGIMLIDTEKETSIAITPERKMYMTARNKRPPAKINLDVNKTKNSKKLVNTTCTEWVTKNKDDGTEIRFWVGGDEFGFFTKFLKVMNRKDNFAKFFMAVPDNKGVFTFHAVEKDSEGKVKAELRVTSIEKKKVPMDMFKIPAGFVEFEKNN